MAWFRVWAAKVTAMITLLRKAFSKPLKPNWCILNTIEHEKRPDTACLNTLQCFTTGNGSTQPWGINRLLSFYVINNNQELWLLRVSILLLQVQHALDTFVSTVKRKPEQLFQSKVFFCSSTSIRTLTLPSWDFPWLLKTKLSEMGKVNICLFCMKVGLWPLKGTLLCAMMGFFNCFMVIRVIKRPVRIWGRRQLAFILGQMLHKSYDFTSFLLSSTSRKFWQNRRNTKNIGIVWWGIGDEYGC